MNVSTSLEAVVTRLGWLERRSRALRYVQHSIALIAAWTVGVLLASRLAPIEQAPAIAALGAGLALVLVAAAWVAVRPAPIRLMRSADLQLGLKERLSTAWERRDAGGPLDAALRRDALAHASHGHLAGAFPIRLGRREAMMIALLAVAAITLALVPNPMNQLIAQRRADQAA